MQYDKKDEEMELKFKDFDVAEFFMPRAVKIAIMVSLLILTTVLVEKESAGGTETIGYSVNKLGFPAQVYGLYNEGGIVIGKDLNELNKGFLYGSAINIAFWYLFACLVFFAYGRLTGRGKL
ncbi:MAG: hypothetical protein AABX01_01255, partial [Candidatus Micrarchaeota archaeon]